MMHLQKLTKKERKMYRLYEMFPGFLTWGTFILAIVLSFIKPLWVIYFVIAFSLYWLFRVTYFIIFVIISWREYKAHLAIDWMTRVKELPDWQNYYHIVFLPTAGEPIEVLKTTIDGLHNSDYPSEKMIVIVGGEARMQDDFLPKAEKLKEMYGNKFYKLIITLHPDGIEGEIKGKGANANYMGRASKKEIDELNISYEKLIVSYFDCDTVAHKKYFSCLTYKYITHPNPTRSSFQPAVLYNNNMWESPSAMRISAFSTTFWLLTELARPDRLFTFSSHSMSYKALVDVGFWENDIVSDDSRIFLQGFFRYDGDYEVTPLYIPVSMDTVNADSVWQGLKNLYKQQRRWAWGVENFPYMMWRFKQKGKKIPFRKKFKYIFNQTEGMYSWATTPILLTILGRFPLWVADTEVKATVIAQNAPFVLEWLMGLAMMGIAVSSLFSLLLLPPRPGGHPKSKYLIMALQWILLPITLILFGSFPATDAQTRMMFGKYLGFFVTPKPRE